MYLSVKTSNSSSRAADNRHSHSAAKPTQRRTSRAQRRGAPEELQHATGGECEGEAVLREARLATGRVEQKELRGKGAAAGSAALKLRHNLRILNKGSC
jgi:hypothetical protein